MASRSAEYYRTHPKAREKKSAYDTEFNKKPSQVKKRAELAKANSEHDKKYGSNPCLCENSCHTSHGLVYKPSSVNRGSKTDTAR